MRADGLLGFDYEKDDEKKKWAGKDKKKEQHVEIKDSEGVDFSYYFSEKYNFIHEKRRNPIGRGGY